MKTPTIEIHVRGGVAYVVRKEANVRVTIPDFDNHPRGNNAERFSASSVIRPDDGSEKEGTP